MLQYFILMPNYLIILFSCINVIFNKKRYKSCSEIIHSIQNLFLFLRETDDPAYQQPSHMSQQCLIVSPALNVLFLFQLPST